MKRFLGILVLMNMTLHCASRLGILNFIYENRHDIAFSLGLIEERPIAICSHEYEFTKGLAVISTNTHDAAPVLPQAHEIQLFFENISAVSVAKRPLLQEFATLYLQPDYHFHNKSVFHPPSFS